MSKLCLHDPLLVCEVSEHDFTRNTGGLGMEILHNRKGARKMHKWLLRADAENTRKYYRSTYVSTALEKTSILYCIISSVVVLYLS